jgi:hypothetical protein
MRYLFYSIHSVNKAQVTISPACREKEHMPTIRYLTRPLPPPLPPPPSPVITNLSLLPYCIPTTYFRNRNIKKCMQDRGIMAIEAVRMTIETIK